MRGAGIRPTITQQRLFFLFFLRVGKETQRSPFPINGSFKVVLSTQFVSAYIVYTVLVCLTKCKDVKKQPHNI